MYKNHIKALFIVIPLLSIGLYFLFEKTKNTVDSSVQRSFELGNSFPDFEGTDIQGRPFKSSNFKDQVVIINFWASWCAPCIEEIPSLIKLVNELDGKVQLIAISSDYSLEEIETFKKSFPGLNHKNITIYWDNDRSYMKRFNIFKLPESYILRKNSVIAKKISGTIDWHTENSIQYFKDLFNE
ncbi:MAG TPA: TlpA disulfide reductase family protein [Pseudobdellovibrionaceae bacterium]|nr:TlpA disulfide reductase family protein [Pseudobdellovibrionaceae bacterium]